MKRVLIIQPTLPSYRVDFFERLNASLSASGGALWIHYAERDVLGVSAAERLPQGPRLSVKRHVSWRGARSLPLYLPLVPREAIEWAEVVVVPGHLREPEAMLSALWSGLRGKRVVWWGSLPPPKSPLIKWARERMLERVDAIATYMPSQRASLPPHLKRKARSLNNGLKPLAAPPQHTLSQRKRAVCVIGRPSEKSLILPWLAQLHTWQGGPLEVHLIGTSKDQWYAARGALEPSHLPSHIKVHAHGYVEREERLMEIMGRCRVSFYPGSVGLSLLEGMRAGLPTLIAAPPAPHMPEREVFVEGEVGRFFTLTPHAHHSSSQPFKGSDWAERLEELLSDEAWLDEAQSKCFQQSARFSTAMMARQMLALTCPELAEPDEPS